MKALKHYDSFNPRRYGNPWVAIVNKATAKPDFKIRVGGYTGGYNRGEAGDLYVTDPKDGAVYMYGQRDYRGSNTEQCYALYTGGEFITVTTETLLIALSGEYKDIKSEPEVSITNITYIAIGTWTDGSHGNEHTILPLTARSLTEAAAVCAGISFAAEVILDREGIEQKCVPIIQNYTEMALGQRCTLDAAIKLFRLIKDNLDGINAAMDQQDAFTNVLNDEQTPSTRIPGTVIFTWYQACDIALACVRPKFVRSGNKNWDTLRSKIHKQRDTQEGNDTITMVFSVEELRDLIAAVKDLLADQPGNRWSGILAALTSADRFPTEEEKAEIGDPTVCKSYTISAVYEDGTAFTGTAVGHTPDEARLAFREIHRHFRYTITECKQNRSDCRSPEDIAPEPEDCTSTPEESADAEPLEQDAGDSSDLCPASTAPQADLEDLRETIDGSDGPAWMLDALTPSP